MRANYWLLELCCFCLGCAAPASQLTRTILNAFFPRANHNLCYLSYLSYL